MAKSLSNSLWLKLLPVSLQICLHMDFMSSNWYYQKDVLTLSFLLLYSLVIVTTVNLANYCLQVTRITSKTSDKSPCKKWAKKTRKNSGLKLLNWLRLAFCLRIGFSWNCESSWKAAAAVKYSDPLKRFWIGGEFNCQMAEPCNWMDYEISWLWFMKVCQNIKMYFMNVETTSIYEI